MKQEIRIYVSSNSFPCYKLKKVYSEQGINKMLRSFIISGKQFGYVQFSFLQITTVLKDFSKKVTESKRIDFFWKKLKMKNK